MNILGIETSCDETSSAVVVDGKDVRSNIVASSLKEHVQFGGIIPEIASRRQMESIYPVVHEALHKAGKTLEDIDAVAVTRTPGLIGSLLVGLSFARALAASTDKPLIEVDHIKAHIYANFLRLADQPRDPYPTLPAIGLVVSGGHSSLFKIEHFGQYKLLGQTRDDAAGEAFDKVARILGLGYPGGPVIDRLAKQGTNNRIHFPQAQLSGSNDFSFSGVKTAVLYYARKHQSEKDYDVAQVAYSFQKSVVEVLIEKSIIACRRGKIKTLLIGGGVAANTHLREQLTARCKQQGINVFVPPFCLCLDNAAMIAGLAYQQHIDAGA